jgi:hypothetical protein
MSSNLEIPKELPARVQDWKRDHVGKFLEANKETYDFDDQHIQTLKEQEFSGRGLLEVTLEELTKCGLKMGPAKCIKIMVDELKAVKGLGELARLSNLVWFKLQLS